MKILKNTTGSDILISDTGINLLANSDYTIPANDYEIWAASSDVITYVGSGDVVVNDGTYDLDKAPGIGLLQGNFIQRDFVPGIKNNNRLKVEAILTGGPTIQVTAQDESSAYLGQKVSGEPGKIELSVLNPGGNEKLNIDIGADVFDKTVDDASDVTNVPSGNISSTDVQSAINELDSEKQAISEKAQPNGYASLDGTGKVPASQLPSYVDDVLEYANLASFPVTGETGKIYVALNTNKTYRWTGSTYVEISPSEVNSVFGRTGIVTAQSGDYTASQVTNVPAGGISSTNVQSAINELDSEKADKTTTVSAGSGLTGGGDLSTNRTISMPNVGTSGTYGSASSVSVITTDAQGRVNGAVSTAISILSSAVTNFAASVLATLLTGLSVATSSAISATDSVLVAFGKLQAQITTLIGRNIATGTGLTGGGNLSADRTIALADTAVSPGTYGSSTATPVFTVDQQGRITSASNVTPANNIINAAATATASTTSTSSSDVLISGMTLTPAAGTYLAIFSSAITNTGTDGNVSVSIYSAGAINSHSERTFTPQFSSGGLGGTVSNPVPVTTCALVTVNGSQAIEARWRRSTGTMGAATRTLILIKVG